MCLEEKIICSSSNPLQGEGTGAVHSNGPRPSFQHLTVHETPYNPVPKGCLFPLTPGCSRRPCWHQPPRSPGLYSQIFEVCSSTKSLSGDGLDGVLTQVPARIKPEGEKHWSEAITPEGSEESGRSGRPDRAQTSHCCISPPGTVPGTVKALGKHLSNG